MTQQTKKTVLILLWVSVGLLAFSALMSFLMRDGMVQMIEEIYAELGVPLIMDVRALMNFSIIWSLIGVGVYVLFGILIMRSENPKNLMGGFLAVTIIFTSIPALVGAIIGLTQSNQDNPEQATSQDTRLQELQLLYENGVITAEEYQQRRQEITNNNQ